MSADQKVLAPRSVVQFDVTFVVVEADVESGLGFAHVLLSTFSARDEENDPAHFVVDVRINGERLVGHGASEFLPLLDEISQRAFS